MIYLVRHGQYEDLDDRDPTEGRGLTALGVEQAQLTTTRLLRDPGRPVHRLWCSDFTRAQQTAEILGKSLGLDAVVDASFREITYFGDTDDPTLGAARRAFEENVCDARWRTQHVIIVCHAELIRYWVSRIIRPPASVYAAIVAHCSITVLRAGPREPALESFAADDHLPKAVHTFA